MVSCRVGPTHGEGIEGATWVVRRPPGHPAGLAPQCFPSRGQHGSVVMKKGLEWRLAWILAPLCYFHRNPAPGWSGEAQRSRWIRNHPRERANGPPHQERRVRQVPARRNAGCRAKRGGNLNQHTVSRGPTRHREWLRRKFNRRPKRCRVPVRGIKEERMAVLEFPCNHKVRFQQHWQVSGGRRVGVPWLLRLT